MTTTQASTTPTTQTTPEAKKVETKEKVI